ncbi:MAG: hypothetical protein AAF645_18515 [Myxococcota bacterium]
MRGSIHRLATIALWLLLASATALGDVPDASQLFRAASAAFESGDYEAAGRAFEAAHNLVPSSAALYNAGIAWERAGDPFRAADCFVRAQEGELTGEQRRHALEAARPEGAAQLSVRGVGRVSVDGRSEREAPTTFILAAGAYVLRPNGQRTEVIDLAAGERRTVELAESAPMEEASGGAPSVTPAAAAAAANRLTTASEPPGRERRLVRAAVPLLSTAGALFVSALAVGAGARRSRDAFVNGGQENADLRDETLRRRRSTNALIVAGSVVGVVGTFLLWRGRRLRVHASRHEAALGWEHVF